MGSGGGRVVSVLAFYYDDPSSNPADVYSFYSANCLKRTKKRPGMAHFFKKTIKAHADPFCIIWLRYD